MAVPDMPADLSAQLCAAVQHLHQIHSGAQNSFQRNSTASAVVAVVKTLVRIPLHICTMHILKMSKLYIAPVALPCLFAVSYGAHCQLPLSLCPVTWPCQLSLFLCLSRCPVTLPCHIALSLCNIIWPCHMACHAAPPPCCIPLSCLMALLLCPITWPCHIALSLCNITMPSYSALSHGLSHCPVTLPPQFFITVLALLLVRGGGMGGLQHCQALGEKAEGAYLRLE